MKERIISGCFLLVIIVFLTIIGGNLLKISLLVASLIGLFEFFRALEIKQASIKLMAYILTIIYYALFDKNINDFNIVFLILGLLFLCILMVLQYPKVQIEKITEVIFAIIYIPVLFSTLYLIREGQNGFYIVWLIYISSFATDTFAYFVGKKFGKHKLAPILSPNKTIEGSIGGIVGAVVIGFLFGLLMINIYGLSQEFLTTCIITSLIGSVFAQLGDLTASAIKRFKNIKDYGHLIPGHGGIVDRFDSLFFTSSIIFVAIIVFNINLI